tara:strand:+ start:3891 stop:4436 length:546 start_codon:yes stop_codon:yes gene_type:complete
MKKARWSKEEESYLARYIEVRGGIKNIDIPNRTHISVSMKSRRMGLMGDGVPREGWTDEDMAILNSCCKSGMTATGIYESGKIKRSMTAIQKKMCRIGLSKKMETFVRLTEGTLGLLKGFLTNRWKTMTPKEMVDEWNSKFKTKINRRKVIYHLTKLDIKKPQGEILKMSLARRRENNVDC